MPINPFIWDCKTSLTGGTADCLPLLYALYVIRRILADLGMLDLPTKQERVSVCAVLFY